MSKILSILLGALCLTTAAFSQKKPLQAKGSTTFGVNVGVNFASASDANSSQSTDRKTGFNGGLTVEHYFSEAWSFKVQALYDQKGWANGFITVGTNTLTTDYKLDYITVPLLANWHFGNTRNWYLQFGPYVSFLTAAQTTANGLDMKPYFNSADAGIDFGVGVKIPVSERARFFIELNAQGGLATINKTGTNATFNTNIRSNVSAINIGINF